MKLGEHLASLHKNKKLRIALIVVAVITLGGAVYFKLAQRHSGTDTTTTNTSAPKQYAAAGGGVNNGSSSSPVGKSSASPANNTATASGDGTLPAPSGQLLNKQTIMLSSSNPQTNADLESVCQTVANASCDIKLTGPNGQSKDVGAQSTGSSGAVIFDWNANTVGLTPGQWMVQAVVTQGSQTGSSHKEYLTVQS